MRDEGKSRFFSFGNLLFAISLLYGGVVKLREILYKKGVLKSKRLPCKVISVGNLTVGGTGKTPMTIYLANKLTRRGYKVAVISRGYGGGAEKSGGIVSDGQVIFMDPQMAGDEPFLIARNLKNVPVVVGQNRFSAGMSAIRHFSPDVIILDDAFQHLQLERDIDLVLLDSRCPFGNGHLLPRGPLREPLSALLRADAFIFTRSDHINTPPISHFSLPTSHSFLTSHVPYLYKLTGEKDSDSESYYISMLKGQKAYAFSGIAKNDDFRRTIAELGCELVGFSAFPDHHRYSDKDFELISRSAKAAKADILVTTEKDEVRIPHKFRFPLDLAVIGIEISFGEKEQDFIRFIEKQL